MLTRRFAPQPDPARPQMCRAHLDEHCRFGSSGSCRFSHTMFDVSRVDVLMDEAVKERGYKDHRPLLEIEYMGRPGEKPMWRVTLRCIVSYSAPEPVVVTATDLNTAFRLLERQFAGSSGKPQASPPPQAHTNAHRRAYVSDVVLRATGVFLMIGGKCFTCSRPLRRTLGMVLMRARIRRHSPPTHVRPRRPSLMHIPSQGHSARLRAPLRMRVSRLRRIMKPWAETTPGPTPLSVPNVRECNFAHSRAVTFYHNCISHVCITVPFLVTSPVSVCIG